MDGQHIKKNYFFASQTVLRANLKQKFASFRQVEASDLEQNVMKRGFNEIAIAYIFKIMLVNRYC